MKCNFKNRMFKGATVLMAAGMIATTSAPAVQAAAPSVMSIVQQAMNMGVAATEVASGTNWNLDDEGTLNVTGKSITADSLSSVDKTLIKKVKVDYAYWCALDVGANAFEGCTNLESVEFPNSGATVSITIGNEAFKGCSKFKGFNIKSTKLTIYSVGTDAFSGTLATSGVTCTNGTDYILDGYGVLTIGQDYKHNTQIDSNIFAGNTSIKSIKVLKSISNVADGAFKNCTNLTSIEYGTSDSMAGFQKIGANAFENTGLTSLSLTKNTQSIGSEAFKNCNSLTDISLTEDKAVGYYLQDLGDNAFYSDSTVATNLTTNSNTLRAYDWAGSNRTVDPSQTEIAIEKVTGYWNNNGRIQYTLDTDGTLTITGYNYGQGYPSLDDPSQADVKALQNGAKVKKVVINGFVTLSMGCLNNNNMYDVIKNASSVEIDNVTNISKGVFANLNNITEVTIPDSVKKLDDGSFSNCNNLTTINGCKNVNNFFNAFYYTGDNGPKETIVNTSNTTLIKQILFKLNPDDDMSFTETLCNRKFKAGTLTIGNDTTVKKVDDTTIQIDGTGNIGDGSLSGISGKIDKVIIGDGVTQIGNNAFANNPGFKDIQGGSNITDVADNAFAMDDYSIATQPLVVESKAVYDNIVKKTQRKNVSLKNGGSTGGTTNPGTVTPPLTPVAENWSYSNVNNQFETDKFSIPSKTADWNIIMDENYNVNGLSEKQGYKSMYSKATSNNEDTVVVCDKASHWMIAIPKDIVLDGASAESTADYRVGIAGEVDPAKRVTVTPDQTVTLVNQGNDQITYVATVDQPVTGVNGFDIVEDFADAGDTLMDGHISATIKRAGSYKGNMSFAIDYVDYVQG